MIKHRTLGNDNDAAMGEEESWTFIGDEADPDLVKRIADWEPMAQVGYSPATGGEKFGARSRALGKERAGEDVGP